MSKLRKFFIGILSAIGILLFFLLLRRMGLSRLKEMSMLLSPWETVLIFLFPLLTFLIAAFRWKVIFSAAGEAIGLWKLWRWTFSGAALSLVVPSFDLSGQTAKAVFAKKSGVAEGIAFGSVFLDAFVRAVNNLVFTLFLLVAVPLFGTLSKERIVSVWIVGGTLFILLLLWEFLRRGGVLARLLFWLFQPRGETLSNVRLADTYLRNFLRNGRLVFFALAISVLGLFWEIIQIALVLSFLNVKFTVVMPFAIFLGEAIPGTLPVPGGIGFKEAGVSFAASSFGLGSALGLATILLLRLRDIATLLLGGFFFAREKFIA